MKHLSLLLAFIAALSGLTQAATDLSPIMQKGAQASVKVESWYAVTPPSGFVPLKVRVKNRSDTEHTWTLSAGTGGFGQARALTSEWKVTAPPNSETETVFYAPVPVRNDSGYYYNSEFACSVSGFGVNNSSSRSLGVGTGYGSSKTEFIAMSKGLHAAGVWGALKSAISSRSSSSTNELYGDEVDMRDAPDDWRGYAGIAQLWMNESEWQRLGESARAAVMDWVSFGGHVVVVGATKDEAQLQSMKVPTETKGVRRYGAGKFTLLDWTGKGVPTNGEQTVDRKDSDAGTLRTQLGDYGGNWKLTDKVGSLSLNVLLIFGFIVGFGLLVGPVNLFWLAGPRKRQRLFWTTPLISVGGSLLLVVLMILQDGIGGSGARQVLLLLQPDAKRVGVVQEQYSKTGVLLRTGFDKAEDSWMIPLGEGSRQNMSFTGESSRQYAETAGGRGGNWFSSRAVQGHALMAVRPSRAALEVFPAATADEAPDIHSSIETTLTTVFIRDKNGKIWKVENLGTGEKKKASAATEGQLTTWLKKGPLHDAGTVQQQIIQNTLRQTGQVFAEASSVDRLAIATLGSISWKDERAVVVGPYVQTGATPPPAETPAPAGVEAPAAPQLDAPAN